MPNFLAYYVTNLRRDFAEYCNHKLAELGLSLGLLYFLLYVGNHPDCAPKQLAEALQMDMGHTTRTLAKLQQGGFLTQTPNPDDRRAHLLRLTSTGENAFHVGHELFAQWDAQVMPGLSQEERELLFSLLARVTPLTTGRTSQAGDRKGARYDASNDSQSN